MDKTTAIAGICAAVCAALVIAGCETARGVAGLSTKALREGRADAVRRTVGLDQETCYRRIEESMTRAGSYIYARTRGHMLAAYVSEADTTTVGVFITPGAGGTVIEVTSPSSFIKHAVAERLFKDLEKTHEQEQRVK